MFENNIIGSGYWGGISGDSGARTTVDYNDIWNLAGTNSSYTIYGGLASVAGSHNFSAGPNVLSNYHLGAGSPCIDAGVYVGIPYNGLAPDLGAFETSATSGTPLTYYVSTRGSDSNVGTYNQAFATIDHARAAIRGPSAPASEPCNGHDSRGQVFLTSPVTFGSGDSGTSNCPVTYKAYNNEDAESRAATGQRLMDFRGQRNIYISLPSLNLSADPGTVRYQAFVLQRSPANPGSLSQLRPEQSVRGRLYV